MARCKHGKWKLALGGQWLWCARCGAVKPVEEGLPWLRRNEDDADRASVLARWGVEKDPLAPRAKTAPPPREKKPLKRPCLACGARPRSSSKQPMCLPCYGSVSRPVRRALVEATVPGVVDVEHRTPAWDAALAACVAYIERRRDEREREREQLQFQGDL